jgi:hypothetical protein
MSVILETAINEIATISGDMDILQHPLSDLHSFEEIQAFMQYYQDKYNQFKNLRFVAREKYTKQTGSRYGVTRKWYDLVGDYKTELLGSLA